MKNILKKLTLLSSLLLITSCSQITASGKWENIVKDVNGGIVTTYLAINESGDSFTANMSAQVSDNANDKLKASAKNIEFSGYSAGNVLVITQVNNSQDPYFTKSTLTLSEEGNRLTLSPSGLVFIKK